MLAWKEVSLPDADGNYSQDEVDQLVADSKKRADEAVARADSAEDAADEAKAAADKAASPVPDPDKDKAPRDFSSAELAQAVEEGQITQQVADEQMQLQTRRTIKREAIDEIRSEIKVDADSQRVSTGIEEMQNAFPALKEKRSQLREKVLDQIDHLVKKRGLPRDQNTELIAMEKVCGDPKLAANETTRDNHRHEAAAAGGGSSAGQSAAGGDEGMWSGIEPARVDHYKAMIDKGHFSGTDDKDLKQELDFIREATAA